MIYLSGYAQSIIRQMSIFFSDSIPEKEFDKFKIKWLKLDIVLIGERLSFHLVHNSIMHKHEFFFHHFDRCVRILNHTSYPYCNDHKE